MDTTYEDSRLFTLLFGLHLLYGKQTNEQTKRQTLSPSITALKRQKQVAVCEFGTTVAYITTPRPPRTVYLDNVTRKKQTILKTITKSPNQQYYDD